MLRFAALTSKRVSRDRFKNVGWGHAAVVGTSPVSLGWYGSHWPRVVGSTQNVAGATSEVGWPFAQFQFQWPRVANSHCIGQCGSRGIFFFLMEDPSSVPQGLCEIQELTDRSDAHGETSPGFVSLVSGGRCDADSLLGGYGASLCRLGLHRCPCREI